MGNKSGPRRYPAVTLRDVRIKAAEIKAGPEQMVKTSEEPSPAERFAPHITEVMLGHARLGVMAVYNKHDWLEDQRAPGNQRSFALHTNELPPPQ